MRYLGGKSRLANEIAGAIMADATTYPDSVYFEPMVGGGSVLAEMAPHFTGRTVASDVSPDLIQMWHAVTYNGWEPPDTLPEDEWRDLRSSKPSPLRGFAGFGCSFGGRFFEGYARDTKGTNYAAQAKRGVMRKAKVFRENGVRFECRDYADPTVFEGDVMYFDPPYAGTKPYSGTAPFDHDRFWKTACRYRDLGANVYVSEFEAPYPFGITWSKERKVGLGVQSGAAYSIRKDALWK